MRWSAQISGATVYDALGQTKYIPASMTTHSECMSVVEHEALDVADPQDPVYMALRDQLESGAIANCEQTAEDLVPEFLISTTCADTGTRAVQTNIFFAEACYEHVSKWEECAIKAGCEPLGNGEYLCNPSDTGETGV